MIPARVLRISGIIILFVELIKGDCSSCPPIEVACGVIEPDTATDGVFSYTLGTDGSGCMTAAVSCTDDSGSSADAGIMDETYVSSPDTSLYGNLFSQSSWIP